jgi:hypothetical protein
MTAERQEFLTIQRVPEDNEEVQRAGRSLPSRAGNWKEPIGFCSPRVERNPADAARISGPRCQSNWVHHRSQVVGENVKLLPETYRPNKISR